MKTLKKLFCACLAVIMVVLSSFVGIFAEDDTTLTVSSNSASVGQTVELDVALSGNSGISFATLAPEYDEDSLELVGVKYNTDKFPGEERFDGTYARWKSEVKDNKENGLFLTLTFKILDTATTGKSEVSLSCPKGYIAGEKSRYTNVSIISGTIDIIPGTPTFEVSSDYALQGEMVEVHVSLKNNPGIAAAKITPVYDKTALELVSVLYNSYGYKGIFLKYNNTNSLKWISEGNEDNFENKRFVTYVFKVIDTLWAESTDVAITYDEGSIVNSKNENIEFEVESGAVIFKETPYTLTVSSPEALPGETVEVDVSVKNNPGISSAEFKPVYDSTVLELIDIKLNSMVFIGDIELTENNEILLAEYALANKICDGVLFTLVFRVLDTAEAGESEVTLSYEEGFIYNRNRDELKVNIESGSVGINSPAIKVSSSEVIPGETFEVDVSLENNPGISAGQLIPVYDNTALELIDVKLNKIDFYGIIRLTPSNKVVFAFSENKISNGVLFTLVFRVLDTAKAGTSEVTLSYDEGDIINTNEDNIKFRIKPGTVEVIEPVLMVSSPEAMPGETVKVDVSLRDNPGILTTTLNLIYDDTELEFLDVNCNNDLGVTLSNKNTVMWFSKNSKNYSEDGVLFTLVFRVLDTAKAGRSEITLSYEAGGIINQKEEDINFIVESGAVNIIAVEPTLNMFSYMADAEAGDTVECMVNLKNNPGIAAVQLTPMYDDTVFELTEDVYKRQAVCRHRFLPEFSSDEIVLMGDSAGGNLAAAVSLLARDRGEFMPQRQILIYPSTGNDHSITSEFDSVRDNGTDYLLTSKQVEGYLSLYVSSQDDFKSPYLAPLLADDLRFQPETLVITAEYCPLRDEGEEYGRRLRMSGNKVKILRIKDALHGYMSLRLRFKMVRKTYELIASFLEKQ